MYQKSFCVNIFTTSVPGIIIPFYRWDTYSVMITGHTVAVSEFQKLSAYFQAAGCSLRYYPSPLSLSCVGLVP